MVTTQTARIEYSKLTNEELLTFLNAHIDLSENASEVPIPLDLVKMVSKRFDIATESIRTLRNDLQRREAEIADIAATLQGVQNGIPS